MASLSSHCFPFRTNDSCRVAFVFVAVNKRHYNQSAISVMDLSVMKNVVGTSIIYGVTLIMYHRL